MATRSGRSRSAAVSRAPAEATSLTELDNNEPDELLCPITFSVFRDPVRCRSDGRVYEKSGILGFWQRRPLADFLGGPSLPEAGLEPAVEMRRLVRRWLDDHPNATPAGWASRDPGPACDQAECDALSARINRAAAARAAAEAAEAGGHAAQGAALNALRNFAPSVRLIGRTPGGRRREFFGVYDRCEDLPLVAGRFAYRQRGEDHGNRTRFLWYAANGFWHAGWYGNLGQQTGWLIVADAAPSPEAIVGGWQLWDGGRLWQAPRVRCVADVEGADEAELLRATGDEALMRLAAGTNPEGVDDDAADAAEEAAQAEEETAEIAAAMATAASSVHLHALAPEFWFSKPELLSWLGTYDREMLFGGGEPTRVNGRFCYAMRRAPDRMLWWANGYWHAGLRAHCGEQTALLIAGDAALVPENVAAPWMWFDQGQWVPSACLVHCAAGPAPQRRGQKCRELLQVFGGATAVTAFAKFALDYQRGWITQICGNTWCTPALPSLALAGVVGVALPASAALVLGRFAPRRREEVRRHYWRAVARYVFWS